MMIFAPNHQAMFFTAGAFGWFSQLLLETQLPFRGLFFVDAALSVSDLRMETKLGLHSENVYVPFEMLRPREGYDIVAVADDEWRTTVLGSLDGKNDLQHSEPPSAGPIISSSVYPTQLSVPSSLTPVTWEKLLARKRRKEKATTKASAAAAKGENHIDASASDDAVLSQDRQDGFSHGSAHHREKTADDRVATFARRQQGGRIGRRHSTRDGRIAANERENRFCFSEEKFRAYSHANS